MFHSPDIFLTRRYLKPRRSLSSIITLLSVLGPALGVTVLIVTTAVFSGFEREMKQRLLGIQAHLHIFPHSHMDFQGRPIISEPDSITETLEEKTEIKTAPNIDDLIIIQFQERMEIKTMSGILPGKEAQITELPESIQLGRYDIKPGEILIGAPFARKFNLQVGDELLVHAPRQMARHLKWREDGTIEAEETTTVHLPEECTVAGIFSFGIYDLDSAMVYMHIDQAAELLGLPWDTATVIKGKVPDPFNMKSEVALLRNQLPDYQVSTWKERNVRLLDTVQVEKNLTLFLLFFIVLVAAFSIAGTLITSVIQKTREIGILKALGLSPFAIARIFLFQGAVIGFIGTVLGCLSGILIIYYRETVADLIGFLLGREIFPPELYHLYRIPAWLTTWDVAVIGGMAFLVCVLAALLPALYASCLKPAQALTEE